MSVTGSCHNKLEKGVLIDYETAFCSVLTLMVLEKIFKDYLFLGFWPKFDLKMKVKVKC
jgi:hypothetical protein